LGAWFYSIPLSEKDAKPLRIAKSLEKIKVSVVFVDRDTPRVVRARNPLVRILLLRYKKG
jgi:hypothetical protein